MTDGTARQDGTQDAAALDAAVEAAADRLRTLPESRLRRGAAAAGLGLARELARRAQRLERPQAPVKELPDAGIYSVGDQLAVAGHDLAAALRTAGATDPAAARHELAAALALIRAHAER
ncbi:hypothetical protein [Streptomyces sp. MP131-18]|uniref:hypothetical protein n=1 Tax=Streptomyces sp. MP131-18 TaxID=1857892 RepID=UPI00097C4237|nr:hypothetical protein [Streptomyces sp. MP131-18]ONK13823.1 hypothetical protein STBA_45980 [Streptomyces sp. MP131-18]